MIQLWGCGGETGRLETGRLSSFMSGLSEVHHSVFLLQRIYFSIQSPWFRLLLKILAILDKRLLKYQKSWDKSLMQFPGDEWLLVFMTLLNLVTRWWQRLKYSVLTDTFNVILFSNSWSFQSIFWNPLTMYLVMHCRHSPAINWMFRKLKGSIMWYS